MRCTRPGSLRTAALGGLTLLVLTGLGYWLVERARRPTPLPVVDRHLPPDPRLVYDGPFENVRPDVRYVGDAACEDCHSDKTRTFEQHPMGRSMVAIGRQASPPPEDAGHNNPFEAFGARFRVERDEQIMRHRRTSLGTTPDGRPVFDQVCAVDHVIGSGTRGFSYLYEEDGLAWQAPISWFAQKGIWDVSPGFSGDYLGGRRPIKEICLFCHTNRSELVEGTINRYRLPVISGHAIGCERCHGPGERHVAHQRLGGKVGVKDTTIVNPRHLAPTLRDAICEQCHLEGEARVVHRGRRLHDFRPGLPADAFWSIYVKTYDPGQEDKAVNHVQQMRLSRCFEKSDGRMGCVSCHDPHVKVGPAERIDHYRKACQACHADCKLPVTERRKRNAEDSCVDCHMPRYSATDIPHTASTNHRVVRAPSPPKADEERPLRAAHLRPFYGRSDPADPEANRDFALAVIHLVDISRMHPDEVRPEMLAQLEAAVQRDPEDWEAAQGRASALWMSRRLTDAEAAYRQLLDRAPHRESALSAAAKLADGMSRQEEAVAYWRRAIAMNPRMPYYRSGLGIALGKAGRWTEALEQADAWIDLDPAATEARVLRMTSLIREDRLTEARAEMERLRALRPPDLSRWESWFRRETRP